ncbi:hypothetical protein [Cellulosimicrobium protaetiae]|uniref:Uncharacterized protein n=1 Tax=Cellulosimicrobium protaetiae TaxID=2587808 RepID=A0A6M5UJ75_9MICO|nr:hypothetical protein [Cellulosimicrobium protaetiae]QJW38747.1 hypothetical protein FIC82_020400 [Cellulosimicrobium protaetiae]
MHITLAAAADTSGGEAWWLAPLVGIVVGALGFSGGLLVRRHEARQARDEMTRRAAADVMSAAVAVMRAAVVAYEAGQPEVWKYQPRRRAKRSVYDRYNDALEHAHRCRGVLAIWRPELREPAEALILAYMHFDPATRDEDDDARIAAENAFLAAVRRVLD